MAGAAPGGPPLVTEAMRAAVGTEIDRKVSFPIAASDIRRWAIAVYFPAEPPGEFWDESYARTSGHGGLVAPEEFNPFAWMLADPPGIKPSYEPGGPSLESELGLPEVPTSHMLNGGTDIEYGVRMRPGDVITSCTTLAGYDERNGRLGAMLFTSMRSRWTNQHDELVKTVVSTVIRY